MTTTQSVEERERLAYERGRREGIEEAAKVADEWAAAYPVDVFPEDSPSLDAKAAGHGRHVAMNIAKDVRALSGRKGNDRE